MKNLVRRFYCIAVSPLIVIILVSSLVWPVQSGGSGGHEKVRAITSSKTITSSKITGAVIEFQAQPIQGKGKGDTAAEVRAILKARAILKTEKPIKYYKQILPPGNYVVRIMARGGNRYLFKIQSEIGAPVEDSREIPSDKKERKKRQKNKENSIIRANFQLQRNRKPTPQVLFDIRKGNKKSKFELTVRAGSSLGRVYLAFTKDQASCN